MASCPAPPNGATRPGKAPTRRRARRHKSASAEPIQLLTARLPVPDAAPKRNQFSKPFTNGGGAAAILTLDCWRPSQAKLALEPRRSEAALCRHVVPPLAHLSSANLLPKLRLESQPCRLGLRQVAGARHLPRPRVLGPAPQPLVRSAGLLLATKLGNPAQPISKTT